MAAPPEAVIERLEKVFGQIAEDLESGKDPAGEDLKVVEKYWGMARRNGG